MFSASIGWNNFKKTPDTTDKRAHDQQNRNELMGHAHKNSSNSDQFKNISRSYCLPYPILVVISIKDL